MHEHDDYKPHSHEVRPDHLGVETYEEPAGLQDIVNAARKIRSDISTIINLVADMCEIEGQDHRLVLEMSQAMLTDLHDIGRLKPLGEYIKRYCDAYDSRDELEEIIANLTGS